ncbi:MAG: hypothetical protein EBR82_63375 [Caulobacteraceae bacterium]|nr:hypothetical protein [Caulobacteraceae bacterium]
MQNWHKVLYLVHHFQVGVMLNLHIHLPGVGLMTLHTGVELLAKAKEAVGNGHKQRLYAA